MNIKAKALLFMIAALVTQFLQPIELYGTVERTGAIMRTALSSIHNTASETTANSKRSMENTYIKGILEKRFRLRSRLNTHLLMKNWKW